MKTYSFYEKLSGLIHPVVYSGPDNQLAANTPPGHAPIEGVPDRTRKKVDITANVPTLTDHLPDKPADTVHTTYSWDETSKEWVGRWTDAVLAAQVRVDRDKRLTACDWVTVRALDQSGTVPENWRAYRQALRDVPSQTGFPRQVVWPTSP